MFVVCEHSAQYDDSMCAEPTTVLRMGWRKLTRSIIVECSDGHRRTCNIDNFLSNEDKKELVKEVRRAIQTGYPTYFVARGNNSPYEWFYQIVIDDGTVEFIDVLEEGR